MCTIEGCGRPAYGKTGLCRMHYQRKRKHGTPGEAEPRYQENAGKQCAVEGCEDEAKFLGWCRMHHARWLRHGSTDVHIRERLLRPGEALPFFLATYLTPAAHDPGWPTDREDYAWITTPEYGKINIHVYACLLAHGPKPYPDWHTAHSCVKNRTCFFADHVRWASPADNENDKIEQGTKIYGELHPKSRLTDEAVAYSRVEHAAGRASISDLARQFDVGYTTMFYAIKGITWKHLP